MRQRLLTILLVFISGALIAGCANRVTFISKGRDVGEQRWKVEKLKHSRLSKDQKALVSKMGKPDYIKFYRPMRKRGVGLLERFFRYLGNGLRGIFIDSWQSMDSLRKIEAWVYEKDGTLIWFKEGRRIEYAAVEE